MSPNGWSPGLCVTCRYATSSIRTYEILHELPVDRDGLLISYQVDFYWEIGNFEVRNTNTKKEKVEISTERFEIFANSVNVWTHV